MFARIENGQVSETSEAMPRVVEGEPLQDWRPLVIEWPDFDKSTHQVGNPSDVIEADRVRRTWVVSPRQPSADDIVTERTRRLALGFNYNFGDARGIHRIGTTPEDMRGWSEVSTFAGALLDSGDITTKIAIVTDTGPCEVTAPEWRAIEIAAAQFRQPLWAKSFVLMQTKPTDYKADSHWQ